MQKKTFVIGEDLITAIFNNLLEQPAKITIQLLDALRAIVGEQSKKSDVTEENVQS